MAREREGGEWMDVQAGQVDYVEIAGLRELYTREAECQLIRYSMLQRELADAYLIVVDGQRAGYGGVLNTHDKGRLVEFYTLPALRHAATPMARALLSASRATHIQSQTNVSLLRQVFFDCTTDWRIEKVLFEDGNATELDAAHRCLVRLRREDDSIFAHTMQPVGDWVVEADGQVVATGGWLTHYNPPYADLYMEVEAQHRRRGFGSYLMQKLMHGCRQHGRTPASRCDFSNTASRRTLERAGLRVCGHLLVGSVTQLGGEASGERYSG